MPPPTSAELDSLVEREVGPGVNQTWKYFLDLCKFPCQSGQEGPIRTRLRDYAKEFDFDYYDDGDGGVGNVVIHASATAGCESSPAVILQGHQDMIFKGDIDEANGLDVVVSEDGKWVKANGTTLGADNRLGLGVVMSILTDKTVRHGDLYFIATVDEESGLSGVQQFNIPGVDFSKPQYIINVDSEDGNQIFNGCAGGGNSRVETSFSTEALGDRKLVQIDISGLVGGHSGLKIHEPRANAIKEAGRLLKDLRTSYGVSANMVSIIGGERHNLIPSDCRMVLAVDPSEVDRVYAFVSGFQSAARLHAPMDNDIEISPTDLEPIENCRVMTQQDTSRVVDLIEELPHGVAAYTENVPDLVETSSNLATIKTEEGKLSLVVNSRSTYAETLESQRARVAAACQKYGANVEQLPSYTGWLPDPNNQLVALMAEEYERLTGKKPKIGPIHAGLELGEFLKQSEFAHMTPVSIGPTIDGAHSTEERVEIESVSTFYRLLKNALQRIAS